MMIPLVLVATTSFFAHVDALSAPLFQESPALQRTTPTKNSNHHLELPDFVELFDRLQKASPLAASVIRGEQGVDGKRGLDAVDDTANPDMKWKITEKNNNLNRAVQQVAKIDQYDGQDAPLLRFRSTLSGPCVGGYFADFMTVSEERKKWDTAIEQVYEAYPAYDLDVANIAIRQQLMRQKSLQHGDCSKLGIGYCQTKANLGISSREQLTLCGVQDFPDKSCIIWGVECAPWHNHMLPGETRHTRAQSHIFSTTLVPTGPDSFDVEYVIQLDIGGRLPLWLTTTVITETVKALFRCVKQHYKGKDGHLESYLRRKEEEKEQIVAEQQSLLMTP